MPSPRRFLARIAGWLTEWFRPGLASLACGVEHRIGTGFDQLASLIKRSAHIAGHQTIGGRDQAGDEPWRLAGCVGPG
ncbi:MAG: hypothetical protein WBB62_14565 [Rhodococcus sp. (in: high G+C Gram-positive bacteria)]|nr:hypothetical protein [uncultured Rhodococcus sp.]